MRLKILGGLFLLMFASLYFLPKADGGWMEQQGVENLFQYNAMTSSITIPAPGSGLRNCISDLSVSLEFNGYVQIYEGRLTNPLSGGTTIYQIHTASGYPILEAWSFNNPLCTAVPNSTMTLTICGLAGSPVFTTRSRINVNGYTRRRP